MSATSVGYVVSSTKIPCRNLNQAAELGSSLMMTTQTSEGEVLLGVPIFTPVAFTYRILCV